MRSTTEVALGKISRSHSIHPMRLRWKEISTSNIEPAASWDRRDFVALALTLFIIAWVFALKLKTFYDLGYSGDLFRLRGVGSREKGSSKTTVLETYLRFTPISCLCRSGL